MPLFTKTILVVRILLYLISWFSDRPNAVLVNEPMTTIYGFEFWRLLTSSLVCKSLFTDILFTMPVYLSLFLYHKEYLVGTFHALVYFTLVSASIQVIATAVYIPIALAYDGKEEYVGLLPQTLDWSFFSVTMVEIFRAALS